MGDGSEGYGSEGRLWLPFPREGKRADEDHFGVEVKGRCEGLAILQN